MPLGTGNQEQRSARTARRIYQSARPANAIRSPSSGGGYTRGRNLPLFCGTGLDASKGHCWRRTPFQDCHVSVYDARTSKLQANKIMQPPLGQLFHLVRRCRFLLGWKGRIVPFPGGIWRARRAAALPGGPFDTSLGFVDSLPRPYGRFFCIFWFLFGGFLNFKSKEYIHEVRETYNGSSNCTRRRKL